MGIEKRLQLIMASNRLTASSFADRIGVQRSNVSHVLNGRNKPGYDFLIKVVQAFPKVNTHWLLTGDEKTENSKEDVLFTEKNTEAEPSISTSPAEPAQKEHANNNSKKIIKTIVFYDDFSFDAFLPSEK